MEQANDINQNTTGGREKLRPVIENLETSIILWHKNLKNFIFVYWEGIKYALIPLAIIIVLNNIEEGPNLLLKSLVDLKLILIILLSLLVIYFILRALISLFLLIVVSFQGKPRQLFVVSREYFWKFATLILLILLPLLLLILATSLMSDNGLTFRMLSGQLLLFVLPLYLIYITYFTLSIFELFNAKHPIKAVRGSAKLVSGHFWSVFGRMVFILIILVLFSLITALPNTSFESGSSAYYLWHFVAQMINLLVIPIVLIFLYNIYMDLMEIKGNK